MHLCLGDGPFVCLWHLPSYVRGRWRSLKVAMLTKWLGLVSSGLGGLKPQRSSIDLRVAILGQKQNRLHTSPPPSCWRAPKFWHASFPSLLDRFAHPCDALELFLVPPRYISSNHFCSLFNLLIYSGISKVDILYHFAFLISESIGNILNKNQILF